MAEFEGPSDTIQPCGGTTLAFNLDLAHLSRPTISRRDQTKRQSVSYGKTAVFGADLKQKPLVLLVRAAFALSVATLRSLL